MIYKHELWKLEWAYTRSESFKHALAVSPTTTLRSWMSRSSRCLILWESDSEPRQPAWKTTWKGLRSVDCWRGTRVVRGFLERSCLLWFVIRWHRAKPILARRKSHWMKPHSRTCSRLAPPAFYPRSYQSCTLQEWTWHGLTGTACACGWWCIGEDLGHPF